MKNKFEFEGGESKNFEGGRAIEQGPNEKPPKEYSSPAHIQQNIKREAGKDEKLVSSIEINSVPVIFSRFFSPEDSEAVINKIESLEAKKVVFLDTPATTQLVITVQKLLDKGIVVVIRDHHDDPKPTTTRGEEIKSAAARLRELAGEGTIISDRSANPSCAELVEEGEFAGEEGTVMVADPDSDGLTAAMKAAGVTYEELDADSAILDGPASAKTAENLSPLGFLLVRAFSAMPVFDPNRPEITIKERNKLFGDFVASAQGDAEARGRLEKMAEVYEAAVLVAEQIAETAEEVVPGVFLVNAIGAAKYDNGTLFRILESKSNCRVTVTRKDNGPIAAKHGGVQYSLAVVKKFQNDIDLRKLVPKGTVSSPEAGIISNTTFLLHVSEEMWMENILPAIKKLQG